jgi:hypothetical protein
MIMIIIIIYVSDLLEGPPFYMKGSLGGRMVSLDHTDLHIADERVLGLELVQELLLSHGRREGHGGLGEQGALTLQERAKEGPLSARTTLVCSAYSEICTNT